MSRKIGFILFCNRFAKNVCVLSKKEMKLIETQK